MKILSVKNVTKVYGRGETAVKALDNVSFDVEQGQFVAIIGPSGSGKSTLLHILGGVDTPSNGTVLVDGNDMYTLDESALAIFRRRQIGLIYQFYNLIPVLNVKENMTLPILLDHRPLNEEHYKHLMDVLDLNKRETHLPNELSGGQQQRVSIGRALIASPTLVLADEPTGNLDRKNSEDIITLLNDIHKEQHQTLIMITHDETIAAQADRILSIEDGKIVKDEVIRR